MEIRGSYSQTLPKKGYGFRTLKPDNISNDNVIHLGIPAENDWVLNSLNYDPSLIRDYIGFNLSNKMGRYASRKAFCEVVVNSEYLGLYLLQEKIKVDKNRINIVKMENTDNEPP
ncbi:MAG: CotH kinase family protein [Saprospiraceae bacterium]